MKKLFIVAFALIAIGTMAQKQSRDQIITNAWQTGRTLPLEIGRQFEPELIRGLEKNDNGYNVLIDIAHQCSFAYMWGLPGTLQNMGYRTVSSQASLNTVLDPKGKCRLRIPYDTEKRIYPFAWYPNFKYNIVITQQGEPDAPAYTATERKALVDWVRKGGALYILASPASEETQAKWSINSLSADFGARMTGKQDSFMGSTYSVIETGNDFEISITGQNGGPIQVRRTFGKGKVVIAGSLDALQLPEVRRTDSQEKQANAKAMRQEKNTHIEKTMAWLASGQKPVGGEPRLPQTMGGGGAIYPELEAGSESIVVFYAPNLNEKLLACVEKEIPSITKTILQWLPSDPTPEPMYLILSAGGGGGWAVNAFKPKENGIISLEEFGLMSVYAHELAHTLGGPSNANKVKAGQSPFGDQGEAHAGWFQGKIDAIYNAKLQNEAVKGCQRYFANPEFRELDIKRYAADEQYAARYGKGKDWSKIWYIWQRLDDTYGPAWYPRWKMTQYERWASTPNRRLTWEESIEDMSIAVGEDLFPFFAALGTSLDRYIMGAVEYQGRNITLPIANIPITAPGKVRIEPIGDYTKPLK